MAAAFLWLLPAAANAHLIAAVDQRDFAAAEAETGEWLREHLGGKINGDELHSRFRNAIPGRPGLGSEVNFLEWTRAKPASYAAQLSTGLYYQNLAWELRGTGYRSQTTDKQYRDLEKYLKLSKQFLERSVGLFAKPYPSHCLLMIAAKGLNDDEGMEAYFAKATAVNPAGYAAHYERLTQMSPKWGGSFEQMDAFMKVVRKAPFSRHDLNRLESTNAWLRAEMFKGAEAHEQAIAHYRKAYYLTPTPEFLWCLVEAGTIAQGADRDDDAIVIFTEVIKATKQPHTFALTHRGAIYETKKAKHDKAYADFLAAAEAGDSWAQNRLGWWYRTGTFVKKDLTAARAWFLKAAAQGNQTAKENLAILDKENPQ